MRGRQPHELVNTTVAHFKQLENLIEQRCNVKYSQDSRVNADTGKFRMAVCCSCRICVSFWMCLYSYRCLIPKHYNFTAYGVYVYCTSYQHPYQGRGVGVKGLLLASVIKTAHCSFSL